MPVPGSIPELLLNATSNRGGGVFGQTTGVRYSALYRFFLPAS